VIKGNTYLYLLISSSFSRDTPYVEKNFATAFKQKKSQTITTAFFPHFKQHARSVTKLRNAFACSSQQSACDMGLYIYICYRSYLLVLKNYILVEV
jgi:type III secretory pathway component EscR